MYVTDAGDGDRREVMPPGPYVLSNGQRKPSCDWICDLKFSN